MNALSNVTFLTIYSGVPNLDYLGLGYHGLIGNPRGVDNAELDPGETRLKIC